jgi:hypothetical protein
MSAMATEKVFTGSTSGIEHGFAAVLTTAVFAAFLYSKNLWRLGGLILGKMRQNTLVFLKTGYLDLLGLYDFPK